MHGFRVLAQSWLKIVVVASIIICQFIVASVGRFPFPLIVAGEVGHTRMSTTMMVISGRFGRCVDDALVGGFGRLNVEFRSCPLLVGLMRVGSVVLK